jgi:O-6-methylguanine DNA methyltransferase
MTSFSQKVILVVKKIFKGKVLTYKEVARRAGNEKAARAVGNILNLHYKDCVKNKKPTIPCHRVVRSDGKIGGYVLGSKKKKELLELEKNDSNPFPLR